MTKAAIIVFIICFIFVLFGFQWMTTAHEKTHQTFYEYYGLESEYEIKWFGLGGGSTRLKPNQYVNITEQDLRILKMFDAVNELVSYQFFVFYWMVSGMFMLIMFFVIEIAVKGD